MQQKNWNYISILKKQHLLLVWLLVASFLFSYTATSQEKSEFLRQRYDGTSELITKNFTKAQLNMVKNNLEREGILFSFSHLKYNRKKEIIGITIHIKNNKSNSSWTWNDHGKPIPTIKTGAALGAVYTTIATNKMNNKNSINYKQ